jgi:NitT/TauT family transport system substrate-binding protein
MFVFGMVLVAGNSVALAGTPLKIAYSDWPGWIAWDIAVKKGFFEKHGVEVEMKWMEYVPSMDAFAAGQVDGVCVAQVDSLVLSASGTRNLMILLNDYSNGNDKLVAKSGINSVKDLKGKRVTAEVGVVSHLLLIKALESNGMTEADITLVNTPNNQAPQVFASGDVDAVTCWQPSSGQALKAVPGSKEVFTSANVPGLIYDALCVSPKSLISRRDDWEKVLLAWEDVVNYMRDPANKEEMLKILGARVSLSPEEYEPLLAGTKILSLEEGAKAYEKTAELSSIYGSMKVADAFFIKSKIYEKPVDIDRTIDGSLTLKLVKTAK